MTEAYATLANHGRHGAYVLVDRVSKDGEDLELPDTGHTEQAVSREAADTTTSILQSVVESGTGTAAQAAGRPAAGKTGTAEEDKAAWFAGYTPDLTTVIAVMGQDPDTGVQKPLYGALGLARINGGGAPAQTWAQYTEAALRGTTATDFDLELESGAEEPAPPTDEETNPQDTGTPSENTSSTAPETPGSTPPSSPTIPGTSEPATGGTGTGTPTNGTTDNGGQQNGGGDNGGPRGENNGGTGAGSGSGNDSGRGGSELLPGTRGTPTPRQ